MSDVGLDEIQLQAILRADYDISLDDAQRQIDVLDVSEPLLNDEHNHGEQPADSYRRALRRLRNLCEWHDLLPRWCQAPMENYPTLESAHPVGVGGYADVFRGTMGTRLVALKRLRLHVYEDKDQFGRREVALWSQMKHPNLLPFIAVFIDLPRELSITSVWMNNGDVTSFIKSNHADVDVRGLILNILDGLTFMHTLGIVHGDLKGNNVLVNENLQACLSDFGLSTMHHTNTMTPRIDSIIAGGSLRWSSPEQLSDGGVAPNTSSDVYSFGVLVWEMITCRIPYDHLTNDALVLGKVTLDGLRPCRECILDAPITARSLNTHQALYTLMSECWTSEPTLRPPLDEFMRDRVLSLDDGVPVVEVELEGKPKTIVVIQPYLGTTLLLVLPPTSVPVPALTLTFLIAGAIRNTISTRYHLLSFHLNLRILGIQINHLVRGTPHIVLMFNSFWAAVSLILLAVDILVLLIVLLVSLPEKGGDEAVKFLRWNLWCVVWIEAFVTWYLDVFYFGHIARRWFERVWGRKGVDNVDLEVDRQIYVSKLPPSATQESIHEVFTTVGDVGWVRLHGDTGHGVVEFETKEAAQTALRSFEEYVMEGRRIQVTRCPSICWGVSTTRNAVEGV
ncbi:hypothetical protein AAF712_011820 [Marasmius tenuissimus]|uniref:Kinase-like protein n=1 Tax=Marasmius tenuissimus TaxID=585030 RepID=A0ABR2ZLP3_9AGAR